MHESRRSIRFQSTRQFTEHRPVYDHESQKNRCCICIIRHDFAQHDGVFVEPASAASVAGILKLKADGYFENKNGRIVCTLTGHGLKDPNVAINNVSEPKKVKPNIEAILKEIGL